MKISNLPAKVSGTLLTGSLFLASAATAYAQNAGQAVGNVDSIPILGINFGVRNLIGSVVNIALAIIGIIAVIYLIWGGVTYITAGGDAEKAGKGRVAITNAIIGIIIIIAALVIYNAVINVGTGQLQ